MYSGTRHNNPQPASWHLYLTSLPCGTWKEQTFSFLSVFLHLFKVYSKPKYNSFTDEKLFVTLYYLITQKSFTLHAENCFFTY